MMPRTQEGIAEIWKMSIATSKAEAERRNVPFIEPPKPNFGKVSDANYEKYMLAITGYSSCTICNGPRGLWGFPVSVSCIRFPIHTVILSSKIEEYLWESRLGTLCSHGYYLTECKECIEMACQQNFAPLEELPILVTKKEVDYATV